MIDSIQATKLSNIAAVGDACRALREGKFPSSPVSNHSTPEYSATFFEGIGMLRIKLPTGYAYVNINTMYITFR